MGFSIQDFVALQDDSLPDRLFPQELTITRID
jgi:hypothetical protein